MQLNILDSLKFVKGSVASKEFIEGLTHFKIQDGTVRGFNGTFALCAPIDLSVDCTPHALDLVKAIENCEDAVQMTLLDNGKLHIKSGKFQVRIKTITKETPHVEPEGVKYEIDGETLLKGLKALQPFISTDASRPWSTGVLYNNGSMFATNNVTLVEYWSGVQVPINVVIPRLAIKELLKLKEVPNCIQVSPNSITFHFDGAKWLRTQTLDESAWPDIRKIIECDPKELNIVAMDESLFSALDAIKPFADKLANAYIEHGEARTHFDETEGAKYRINDTNIQGVWRIEILQALKGVAKNVAFNYPQKSYFFGDNLRGVFLGVLIQ